MDFWVWIIIAIVVILLAVIVGAYNGLIGLRNQVKNAWAQIDVQLKRRFDLIPNLMETVRGYMKHERETLEAVTNARNMAQQLSDAGAGERGKAEGLLGQALGRLLAVAENYPDLKANQNVAQLQEELTSTENKIAFARQYYNDNVMRYNTRTEVIPTNFVANIAGFKKEEFFEAPEEEKEVPKVDLR